jgi:hypothetical protein
MFFIMLQAVSLGLLHQHPVQDDNFCHFWPFLSPAPASSW